MLNIYIYFTFTDYWKWVTFFSSLGIHLFCHVFKWLRCVIDYIPLPVYSIYTVLYVFQVRLVS